MQSQQFGEVQITNNEFLISQWIPCKISYTSEPSVREIIAGVVIVVLKISFQSLMKLILSFFFFPPCKPSGHIFPLLIGCLSIRISVCCKKDVETEGLNHVARMK